LRLMASKNICSDGYIQLPLFLSWPLSASLFAGLSEGGPESSEGMALGMVETSRSLPRRSLERMGELGEDAVWFIWEESQLSPAGIDGGELVGGM